MQLIEHHPLEAAEEIGRIRRREDEGELLRCREQNVRRVATLTLAP